MRDVIEDLNEMRSGPREEIRWIERNGRIRSSNDRDVTEREIEREREREREG